jgi:DNA polymerase III sliding clamp (beta) subunit (PCNA family)
MELVVESDSYNAAISTITSLLGSEVDCILKLDDSKARIEASSPEAYIQVPLRLESSSGDGACCTRIEYLSVVTPKTKTIKLVFEEGDHIKVTMGRSRGAIRVLPEEDIDIERPETTIGIEAVVPAKLLVFASGATAFKPLIDASSPSVIIEVDNREFNISAYDTYMGTHYGVTNEEVRAKEAFRLTVELDVWKNIIAKVAPNGVVKMGADDSFFRLRTDTFDLYHAVMQEDSQDVKEVITTLKSEGDHLAVVEFDANAVTKAIDDTKGVIRSADKDGSRFCITLKKEGLAIISAESVAGEMESEFDINVTMGGDDDVEFRVSSDTFQDILKLTRDEGLKYGPARMLVMGEVLVMESLKVPASSVSPMLQE